jgi:hypothetical protein
LFYTGAGEDQGFGTRIGTGQRNILKSTRVPEFADIGRANGQKVSPRLVNGRVLYSLHDNILKRSNIFTIMELYLDSVTPY